MATAPSERQTLFLWAPVAEGGAAAQKEIKPDVAKPDRDALLGLGLLHARPAPLTADAPALATHMREAYFNASGGAANRQVWLADLRDELADVPRADLDAALLRLQGESGGLLPLDDPRQVTAADRAAELLVGGRPRHLLWLDR